MPITVHAELRRIAQKEFGAIAYEVMQHVFAVHAEFGRCFDEDVYLREVARRCAGQSQVAVEVAHRGFLKRYYLDLLVANAAVFEFKTVAVLTDRHRDQLLYYLLLTDLPHGKLVNFRTNSVQHEFVNTTLTIADRQRFRVDDRLWDAAAPGAAALSEHCLSFVHDVGSGLAVSLYEEALVHFLGGESTVIRRVPIPGNAQPISSQLLRFAAPRAAFRITALDDRSRRRFSIQLQRFLAHVPVDLLHWINIYRSTVTLTTLRHP